MAAWKTSASENKAHTFAQPIKRPMESNFSSPIIGANMGMKKDEVLSGIATFKYQVQFLAFASYLNCLT